MMAKIHIRNVATLNGETSDISFNSDEELELDASGLTLIPALIDPHVHFRVPGAEHKENWISASQAAIRGGLQP